MPTPEELLRLVSAPIAEMQGVSVLNVQRLTSDDPPVEAFAERVPRGRVLYEVDLHLADGRRWRLSDLISADMENYPEIMAEIGKKMAREAQHWLAVKG